MTKKELIKCYKSLDAFYDDLYKELRKDYWELREKSDKYKIRYLQLEEDFKVANREKDKEIKRLKLVLMKLCQELNISVTSSNFFTFKQFENYANTLEKQESEEGLIL